MSTTAIPLRTVHLHGFLGERFGASHRIRTRDVGGAFRFLDMHYPKFRRAFSESSYEVIVRPPTRPALHLDESTLGLQLPEGDIHFIPAAEGAKRGGIVKIVAAVAIIVIAVIAQQYYAVPAVVTAGEAGVAAGAVLEGSVMAGTAAVGAAAAPAVAATAWGSTAIFGGLMTAGQLAGFGAAMLFSGIAQLLTPKVKSPTNGGAGEVANSPSFLYRGPVNLGVQGVPVPLVVGRVRAGTVVISAGLFIEEIPV